MKQVRSTKNTIGNKCHVFFQLVPPEMHWRNWAERVIQTFKNHFLSILAGVDPAFPPYLWDLQLLQAELMINLLCKAHLNPKISAWEYFNGPFDFNKTPLGPVGCRVLINAKPAMRRSLQYPQLLSLSMDGIQIHNCEYCTGGIHITWEMLILKIHVILTIFKDTKAGT